MRKTEKEKLQDRRCLVRLARAVCCRKSAENRAKKAAAAGAENLVRLRCDLEQQIERAKSLRRREHCGGGNFLQTGAGMTFAFGSLVLREHMLKQAQASAEAVVKGLESCGELLRRSREAAAQRARIEFEQRRWRRSAAAARDALSSLESEEHHGTRIS